MNATERSRFDALFERVLETLPAHLHALIEESPVILEDQPDEELARELGLDPDEDVLCGLHTGIALTERSVEQDAELPNVIHLFRQGIVEEAGGWEAGDEPVIEQIRITLLHEMGHHFGLDEDDLDALGYA